MNRSILNLLCSVSLFLSGSNVLAIGIDITVYKEQVSFGMVNNSWPQRNEVALYINGASVLASTCGLEAPTAEAKVAWHWSELNRIPSGKRVRIIGNDLCPWTLGGLLIVAVPD